MSTSMGLATCFPAMNKVYGKAFDVEEDEDHQSSTATAEVCPRASTSSRRSGPLHQRIP